MSTSFSPGVFNACLLLAMDGRDGITQLAKAALSFSGTSVDFLGEFYINFSETQRGDVMCESASTRHLAVHAVYGIEIGI